MNSEMITMLVTTTACLFSSLIATVLVLSAVIMSGRIDPRE